MRRVFQARYLASALAISAVPYVATAIPAAAQMYADVSFDAFHDQLAQYGYWAYSDRWGLVWQPGNVSNDFRPYYTGGYWAYTDDYGWYWVSDYPWGDVTFHYGRWVDDPDDGWLWIPGYTWSPGWVTWRSNGQYIGWMPLPPDQAFLEGRGDVSFGIGAVTFNWNNDPYFGYRRWYGPGFDEQRFADNWVFVGAGDLALRDYRRVAVRDPRMIENIIHQTRNVTKYAVVNGYVVNRSVDVRVVQHAAGHPIQAVPARTVIRNPNLVMRADVSQRIQMRERAVAPRGTGLANSAPPPPPSVIGKLSPQAAPRNGNQPAHLFTRTTINNPDVQSHFHGKPVGGGPSNEGFRQRIEGPQGAQPGGMSGPATQGPGASENQNPPSQEPRRGMQGPEGAHPGGINAPGNDGGMSGYQSTRGSGGNENPSQPPPEYHHRTQTPQPGGMAAPGTMNGPGGVNAPRGNENQNPPSQEFRQRTQAPQGGSSSGMNGPGMQGQGSNASGPAGTTEQRPRATPGNRQPPPPPNNEGQPPKPEKKEHPDHPPGQPQ